MNRKAAFILGAILLLGGCGFLGVNRAQAQMNAEAIDNFSAVITVKEDNSVDVSEVIDYNAGPISRHGIYRDIKPISSEGRTMEIRNVSVFDNNNQPYPFTLESSNGNVRIKIGDANVTFNGKREYRIFYTATNAVAHLKDVDEIYWNVTGNNWLIPIYKATAEVTLPANARAIQSACYYGLAGSTQTCEQVPGGPNGESHEFISPVSLSAGQGLTVAVGFPKGIVPEYSAADNFWQNFGRYIIWVIAILLPILTFILAYRRWSRLGRDPKGTGVIIPQYDVPDGLTPFEIAGILNEKVQFRDFSSEIIYLATRGYLKIKQIENTTLGIFKSTDYEFTLLKDYADLPNLFDKLLLGNIFNLTTGVGEKRTMSSMKNSFYACVQDITDAVNDALLAKGYYSNLPKGGKIPALFFLQIFLMCAFFGTILLAPLFINFHVNGWPILAGASVSAVIIFIFKSLMAAKTAEGVAAREYILGLKDYLQIAEKDRLQFHNAPEKRPETFEKLLPFAMVLGVNAAWAKEFEGIYTSPPDWYESYPVGHGYFSAIAFNNSLSSFGTIASTSMGSSPGGSGGGGSSGGGGGGGGGGGW